MAKDIFHGLVRTALQEDGWEIRHDPLRIAIGRRQAFIDLGARDLLTAQKGQDEIAVEVKSFLSPSLLDDLYEAIGQYLLYQFALEERSPATTLYLALPNTAWRLIVEDQIVGFIEKLGIKIIVFDPDTQQLLQWIN